MATHALPLEGVKVLDLTNGKGEIGPRLLADLGADVIRVESAATDRSRAHAPVVDGISLYHEAFNANKRSLELDITRPEGRATLERLLPHADIVFTSYSPAEQAAYGIEPASLRAHNPALVALSLTDFGLTGPYRDWAATEWTHLAFGGIVSRSGAVGREPLIPPLDIALQTAGIAAAWAALFAYWNRLETGVGDSIDTSVFESVVQAFDPGWGMGGSATGGVPASDGPRGRIDDGYKYPLFPCADGVVRLAILSPRQWQGMFAWMGSPAEFADERWNNLAVRFAESGTLYPAIGETLRTKTRDQIVIEAQQYGVPAAAVLTPAEVVGNEHFAARHTFTSAEVAGGHGVAMVDGLVELDGERTGYRSPAPALGRHTAEVLAEFDRPAASPAGPTREAARRPFEGLRVLDLGVIVAGGEAGRLFADLGAEVLKIESLAVPDGSRQSRDGSAMNAMFAWGNRNKLGFGLNLKDPQGRQVFLQLVEQSDVVLSNFKPGTMAKFGLSYDVLKSVNPGVVLLESSAYGHTGPWSGNPGYGPVVRSAVGVTGLWRYGDDPLHFYDHTTVYPDHVAARVAAIAVLAKLVDRRTTGVGGTVHLAQTEVVLGQHAHVFAAESLAPGTVVPVGNDGPGDAPRGIFQAAGDDEWLVVDVQGDDQWQRLATVLGLDATRYADSAARVRHRAEIGARVAAWTAQRSPEEGMALLQEAGVPSAKMMRITEFPDDPHLVARRTFRETTHPLIKRAMPSENLPGIFTRVPDTELRPAPLLGQHTREVAGRLLGLDDSSLDGLFASGVLQQDPRIAELFRSAK